jgi:hypothetical protein
MAFFMVFFNKDFQLEKGGGTSSTGKYNEKRTL